MSESTRKILDNFRVLKMPPVFNFLSRLAFYRGRCRGRPYSTSCYVHLPHLHTVPLIASPLVRLMGKKWPSRPLLPCQDRCFSKVLLLQNSIKVQNLIRMQHASRVMAIMRVLFYKGFLSFAILGGCSFSVYSRDHFTCTWNLWSTISHYRDSLVLHSTCMSPGMHWTFWLLNLKTWYGILRRGAFFFDNVHPRTVSFEWVKWFLYIDLDTFASFHLIRMQSYRCRVMAIMKVLLCRGFHVFWSSWRFLEYYIADVYHISGSR